MYKTQMWTICIGLWFEGKKWGHLRTVFSTSRYCYLEVENILLNIWAEDKYFQKYFGMLIWGLGTINLWIKTRGQKSHTTVPLIQSWSWHNFADFYKFLPTLNVFCTARRLSMHPLMHFWPSCHKKLGIVTQD